MQKILIIDDEISICQALAAFLRRLGYTIDESLSLEDALSKIDSSGDYSLIITDMVLTDGNSIELIKQVKENSPSTKLIAMTGYSRDGEDSMLTQAEKAGADMTVTKPFSLIDMKSRISKLLCNN